MNNQDFDMDTYIKQRLMEIEDTDERSFAKTVLLKGLLPAFQTMEERYRELENRIRREVRISDSQFAVMITLIRKQDYDVTNRTWFPVCEFNHREEGEAYRKIYFQGNRQQKRVFEKTQLRAVDCDGKEHLMGIRVSNDYRTAMEGLYQIFVYNRIPWNTVNTGYLDRFYEIYPLDESADIQEWTIHYGEWENMIYSNYIAVWNIEKFDFSCMRFMVPGRDGKYYEHELDLKQYDEDSGYMVGKNKAILSIRYEKDKIIMTSTEETFDDWVAYRFGRHVDLDSYGYHHRILGNCKLEGFVDGLIERQGGGIHSKTDLFRMVESLNVGKCLKLVDCSIREYEGEESFSADMNWFIREEVFPMETRRILELQFMKQSEEQTEKEYFVEDILRYVISQVQLLLDEYKCVGVLI